MWQWHSDTVTVTVTPAELWSLVKGLSSGSRGNRSRGKCVSEASGECRATGTSSSAQFIITALNDSWFTWVDRRAFLFLLCLCWESGVWDCIVIMTLNDHGVSLHPVSATFSHISWTEILHRTCVLISSLDCASHSCVQYLTSLTANTLKASQTCPQLGSWLHAVAWRLGDASNTWLPTGTVS